MMIIQQEMKWIGYLQLGINILLLFFLSSCEKKIGTKDDFRYINETTYEVYIYAPPNSLTIKPLDTGFIYRDIIFGNGTSKVTEFHTPNIFVLKYDDVKCDTLSFNDTVLNPSNYDSEDLGGRNFLHTYRFTEEDYERAIDCE